MGFQTLAHDPNIDGEEKQTGQPHVEEDIGAAEFQQVGEKEPDSLGCQPNGRQSDTFALTELQLRQTQRQQTQVPQEILRRDHFVERHESVREHEECQRDIFLGAVTPRQQQDDDQLRQKAAEGHHGTLFITVEIEEIDVK